MIFDINSRELSLDDGTLLKKLDCPLDKKWSELKVLQNDKSKRQCASCQKYVVNLIDMSDEEVEALFKQSPDCCVYIPGPSSRIKIKGRRFGMKDDPCPFRRIHTARGLDAINREAKNGFWPLVKQVVRSAQISSWMEVYQNEETGEIMRVGDRRWSPQSPWKRIIKPFRFYPHVFEHEIAAYLIPSDLKFGERVFLTDLIEDRVGIFGNQEHTYRLECAYAIWNGRDFTILWWEWKDAEYWVG